ncbi:MAG TPA: biopolymer transporter ExbD [Candidatus Hydrogenedentes bacterium]|nr:biopolymer transporter ExbD [Candidatus Hydrogenedentota bacterium]HOL76426.1 biopolymer transporter ExbD [Candidatus Hydrogenedentota bacterium]HPO85464.1 biopolymer transporter ExbD [Candidatus Hydrogenedentota bacterium]
MTGAFGSRRTRRRPIINITSLIDVMFLLVIFLTVSTTFREQLGIEIDLPEAATSEEHEKETPKEILITREGEIFFGGQAVDENGLREALRGFVTQNPETPIVLRADAKADFGPVVRALDIAREVGGTKLIIPTAQPEERGQNP